MPVPSAPPARPPEDDPARTAPRPGEHYSAEAPAEGADDTPPETAGSPRG